MKNLFSKIAFLFLVCTMVVLGMQQASAQNGVNDTTTVFRNFKTKHVWDAKVKVASMIMVGESKRGTRRVIPITGGTFEGPEIKGEVLPGGEDWQLVRPDGDTELEARYLLKTDDGVVIQVINKVLMHMPKEGADRTPYVRSVIDLEAPTGSKYDYLNHSIFLGTLEMPRMQQGEEPHVVIGVYQVL